MLRQCRLYRAYFCAGKLYLFPGKSAKILQQELLFFGSNMKKSFVGWGFASDPTGGA